MAYVVRRRGMGQSFNYQGPCPEGQGMDPTTGTCQSIPVLQQIIQNLSGGGTSQSSVAQIDYTPFFWIAAAFVVISLIGGRR